MPKCVWTWSLGTLPPSEGSVPLLFFFSLSFWSYMSACGLYVGWVYWQLGCLLGWMQLLQAWRLGAVECAHCGSSFEQPQYCTPGYTFWSGVLQIPDVLGLLNFSSFHLKVGLENSFLIPTLHLHLFAAFWFISFANTCFSVPEFYRW